MPKLISLFNSKKDAPVVVPLIINKFRAYGRDGKKLVGVGEKLELPEIKTEGYTMEGAGLPAKFEQPAYGILEPMEADLPFSVFYGDISAYAGVGTKTGFTIRSSVQAIDLATGRNEAMGLKADIRGIVTAVKPGEFKQGEQMDCSCTLSVYYLRIGTSDDGGTYRDVEEIDIFNGIYKAGGKDMLAGLKKLK